MNLKKCLPTITAILVTTLFPATQWAKAALSPEGSRTIPNERTLSEEDYAEIGKIVWLKLQELADQSKRDLSDSQVGELVDEMQRNRGEANLTLDQLSALMLSNSFCGPQKPQARALGISLDSDPRENYQTGTRCIKY